MMVCVRFEISYNDYVNDMCVLLHTTKCNLQCHYCFNLKNTKNYPKTVLDYKYQDNEFIEYIKKELIRTRLPKNICITGGDPIYSMICENSLKENVNLFNVLHNKYGFNIKLDVNGMFPEETKLFFPYLEHIALDVKVPFECDPDTKKKTMSFISKNMSYDTYYDRLIKTIKYILEDDTNTNLLLRTTVSKAIFSSNKELNNHIKMLDEKLSTITDKRISYRLTKALYLDNENLSSVKEEIELDYDIEIPSSLKNTLKTLDVFITGNWV